MPTRKQCRDWGAMAAKTDKQKSAARDALAINRAKRWPKAQPATPASQPPQAAE